MKNESLFFMQTENIKLQVKTQINEPEDMCEKIMQNVAQSDKWAEYKKDTWRDKTVR